MAHSIKIISADNQIPLLPQTEKDEIEEGSKVDHSLTINQIFTKKFKDLDNSSIKSCTIFRVNVWLRESNPNAYTPKMVSIGPYHKKDVQLHRVEKFKLLYLQRFLGRKEGVDVESCINELEGMKDEAIKCYEDINDLNTDEFCQMLLLDGCFVVEFIREHCRMFPGGEYKIMNSYNANFIIGDLILLENQLPFFVLNKLHDMTKRDDEPSLARIAADIIWFPFLVDFPKPTIETYREITEGNIKHLLHLKHVISSDAKKRESLIEVGNGKDNDEQMWHMVMPNATELSEAGVRFAKATVKTSIFDSINFENGFMKIPRINVEDDTETLLRNIIAYEQQSVDVQPKYFSNFATFMNNLIESDKDVNLLCHKGIIVNWLGDNKEVVNLFNKIGNGVISTARDFYYKEECRKVVKHYKKPWNKMKANLLRNYFSSPWVGASTVAAIVLLILTLIQAILAFTGPAKK